MSIYLVTAGAAGLMVVVLARIASRYATKRQRRQRLRELQREAETSWARTLERLESERVQRTQPRRGTR